MKTSRLALGANPCGATHPCASAATRPAQSVSIPRVLIAILFGVLIGQTATAASVKLAWNPNPETDIASYNLSYGTSSGAYSSSVNTGTATNTTVSGLNEGSTYYFVVRAINTAGLESDPSSELAYQVPISAPANQAPVASSMAVSTAKDTPLAIVLGGSDAEGAALSFSIVSGPVNGVLSGSAPNLSYSPSANFTGSDSFTFLVNDGSLNSSVATVNINVTALAPGSLVNGSFESGYAGWAVTGNAYIESEGSPYTATDGVKLASLNGNSTSDSPPNAVLSQVFATTAGATYTLAFDMGVIGSASGEQKIQVTADGAGNVLSKIAVKTKTAGGTAQWSPMSYTFVANSTSTTLTFRDISTVTDGLDVLLDNVRVVGAPTLVNTAPVASSKAVTTAEDAPLAIVLEGSDAEANALTFNVVTAPVNGTLTGTAPNLTYTPRANANGSDSFTFVANDGKAVSNTATVSITISPVNDTPVAAAQLLTATAGVPLSVVLSASDPDGDSLTFSIVSSPAKGSLSGIPPNLTYTPNALASGSDSFRFSASDGKANSTAATISFNITPPPNVAPVAAGQSVSTPEDQAIAIRLAATDVNGDVLGYRIITQPSMGTLSGTAPNLTYTPGPDANGNDSFTFRANDGKADSNTATVSIAVSAVNDAPLAQAQELSTLEDKSVGIFLYATDKEGESLSYSVVVQPAKGRLTGTAPNLTYVPNPDANGSDSFTFRASDGAAQSNTATVSLVIAPVNDAPVAAARFVSTDAGMPALIVLSASDKDGDTLSYTIVSQPMKGLLSGTPPRVTYTPYPGAEGSDSLSFRANDGTLNSNTASISITLVPVVDPNANDAPEFQFTQIRRAKAKIGEQYASASLAGTAIDPDGDALTYSRSSGPEWLTVASDGSISGTPTLDTEGINNFTVRATDAVGAYSEASLEIEVVSNGLPLPWTLASIGSMNPLAEASGDSLAIRLLSSGALAGTADNGLFAWQTLSGDGEVTVRIRELENTDTATRIGLMIRESLATNSKHTFIGTDGRGYVRWVRRTKTAGSTSISSVAVSTPLGLWLRLNRVGTTVSAFTSSNGTDWTRVGRVNVELGATCYIGLSAHSGSADKLSAAVFDNITVTP